MIIVSSMFKRYEYLKNELTSCCFAIILTATQVIFVCRLFVSDMQKCTLTLCTLYFMFLSFVLKFGCSCINCIYRKNWNQLHAGCMVEYRYNVCIKLWFLGKNTEIDLSINVHFVGQCDFESFIMNEVISINAIIQCIITISNLKTISGMLWSQCMHVYMILS